MIIILGVVKVHFITRVLNVYIYTDQWECWYNGDDGVLYKH